MSAIAEQKSELRKSAALRRDAAAADMPDAGTRVAERILAMRAELGLSDPRTIVSAYWPMASEIDTRPLMTALSANGHRIGLPVVVAKGRPLVFRLWRPGDPLRDGGFGTRIPETAAAEVVPDVLMVPMLAFDRRGYRLGYGGGFYDRTLERLRGVGSPVAVGIAFSAQRVEKMPTGPYDQPLDWIVTEAGVTRAAAHSAGTEPR